jgi:hypothetical protein
VRDVAVSWAVDGDCPLMGVGFVDVCGRVFDVCEGRCAVAVGDGAVD